MGAALAAFVGIALSVTAQGAQSAAGEVPQGHTVALVGATGAGKSTIVKLLSRFYDPTAGRITWDGTDVRHVASQDLRARIAYVPQETFLFSDTLGANIALDPGRISPERMRAAASSPTWK